MNCLCNHPASSHQVEPTGVGQGWRFVRCLEFRCGCDRFLPAEVDD